MQGKKTGGRKKGVANRATAITKQIFSDLLSDYHDSGKLQADFYALPPRDRIYVAEKMAQYCIPKIQSVALDIADTADKATIQDKLIALAQD